MLDSDSAVRIIDVRPRTEFGICQLPGSISELMYHDPFVVLIPRQMYPSVTLSLILLLTFQLKTKLNPHTLSVDWETTRKSQLMH